MIKLCEVCNKPYAPGTRNANQYAASKYCSLTCSGVGQQNNLQHVFNRIKINQATGCHEWTGCIERKGYGRVKFQKRKWLIHRLIWEKLKGPVPDGLQLDHTCGNKKCCN